MPKNRMFTGIVARIVFLLIAASLAGCTGALSLPGGDDTNNSASYTSPDDLLSRLNAMQPGLAAQDVFVRLGHAPSELNRLQKPEILQALYGSTNVSFDAARIGDDSQSRFLASLYGYSLNFKTVKKEMGFNGPFRIETDENGFDYTAIFVFQNGKLYAAPIVTGGVVRKSTSKTLFEFLNPGMVTKHL